MGKCGNVGMTNVETGGKEDAESDEQLVSADERATNPGRRGLGLEHGHDETKGSDTEAGDETTDHDLFPGRLGGDLDDETDGRDDAPERDGVSAAELVCDGSADESTDEGTDGEETDNQTGADVAETGTVGPMLAEAVKEVGHLQETRDLTGVVSEAVVVSVARIGHFGTRTYTMPPMEMRIPIAHERPVMRLSGE